MYPHERSLVKNLQDKPFALLGVNSDRDLDQIREVVKEKNITWRSFWNGPEGTSGPISKRWDVSGWPTIYVIDANGIIRHKQAGGTREPLDNAITEALADLGHDVDISQFKAIDAEGNEEGHAEEEDDDTDDEGNDKDDKDKDDKDDKDKDDG